MDSIPNCDGPFHKRWIHFILSLFITGSAQYLSGRKRDGIICFAIWMLLCGLYLLVLLSPYTKVSVREPGYFFWFLFSVWLAITLDSLRKPIRRIRAKSWLFFFGLWLCISIALPLVVSRYFVHPFSVPTNAMAPTILGRRENSKTDVGDCVLANTLIYRFEKPKRGDIVAFKSSGIKHPFQETPQTYVKRIVGLPGEAIGIHPPYITINGRQLDEPPVFQKISECADGFEGYQLPVSDRPNAFASSETQIVLGANEYFVLGDHSSVSMDSRYYGPIQGQSILGKVFYVYAPANRKGFVR